MSAGSFLASRRATLGVLAAAAAVLPPAADAQRPPPILLESRAGLQRAVQESYCVFDPARRVGACVDTVDALPRRFSVVRPGERVAIVLRNSRVVLDDPRCHPRCEAGAVIHRLGTKRVVRTIPISSARTRWRLRLGPGAYELEVFIGNFAAADGRTGDTSGTLGLLVSRTRRLAILPASAVAPPRGLAGREARLR
jgi:hypothetical protein